MGAAEMTRAQGWAFWGTGVDQCLGGQARGRKDWAVIPHSHYPASQLVLYPSGGLEGHILGPPERLELGGSMKPLKLAPLRLAAGHSQDHRQWWASRNSPAAMRVPARWGLCPLPSRRSEGVSGCSWS